MLHLKHRKTSCAVLQSLCQLAKLTGTNTRFCAAAKKWSDVKHEQASFTSMSPSALHLRVCLRLQALLPEPSVYQMKSQNRIRSRVIPSSVKRRVSVAVTDPGSPDISTAQSLGSPPNDPIKPCSLPKIACSSPSCTGLRVSKQPAPQ